jgi:hypothetical protein
VRTLILSDAQSIWFEDGWIGWRHGFCEFLIFEGFWPEAWLFMPPAACYLAAGLAVHRQAARKPPCAVWNQGRWCWSKQCIDQMIRTPNFFLVHIAAKLTNSFF